MFSPLFWTLVAAVWLLGAVRWRLHARSRIADGSLTRREADALAAIGAAIGLGALGLAWWSRSAAGIGDLPPDGGQGFPLWLSSLRVAIAGAAMFWVFVRGGDRLVVRAFARDNVSRALLTPVVVRIAAVIFAGFAIADWIAGVS